MSFPFGVRPATAWVAVDGLQLMARFGPWRLSTGLDNILDAQVAGPYRWWRIAGPARLSLADRGLTFATNARQDVCIGFAEPVPGIDRRGRIRHPNLTVTVADCAGLLAALGH